MIYLFVLSLLLCLSLRYDINGKRKYRNHWYFIMLVFFSLIAGLRWRVGVDTIGYLYSFHHVIPSIDKFSLKDFYVGRDPLWVLINSIVLTLGGKFYIVQIIQAVVVNTLIFVFIKRHSQYIFTCLLFYAIFAYINLMMEVMRASFSIAICLLAYDYILEKKWIKGYFLLSIALFFHAQTLVFFILPIFFFIRLNIKGFFFLIGAFLFGYVIQESFGDDIITLFADNEELEAKLSGYGRTDQYIGQYGNFNRIIVQSLPFLLFPFLSICYVRRCNGNEKLIVLEPMVMIGIAFVLIRLNFELVYRYVDFFKLYFGLYCTETFVGLVKSNYKLSLGVRYLRSIMLFSPVLFFSMYSSYASQRYLPYTSVIEKKVSEDREKLYRQIRAKDYHRPNVDIY